MNFWKRFKWMIIAVLTYISFMVLTSKFKLTKLPSKIQEMYGELYYHNYLFNNWFVPAETPQFSLNYQFELSGQNICEKEPYLIILILTVHDHVSEREAIRKTWGSVAQDKAWLNHIILPHRVRIAFLLAHHDNELMNDAVKDENERTGDIVLTSQREHYDNLTLKVLMGFKWVQKYCNRSTFVMKVDEDHFVGIPSILDKLNVDMDNKILGAFARNEEVKRGGKYHTPKSDYPFHTYPPHVKGAIYVMKTKLSLKILSIATYFNILRMEDVFITGVLAWALHVRHVNFSPKDYKRLEKPEPCDYIWRSRIASLVYDASDQFQIWKVLLDPGKCTLPPLK